MAPHRPGEEGYVLITALWLLLLCGSVVALMMLRNQMRSERVRDEAEQVQAEFDARAATATVMADLLFRGPASRWASLPADGMVTIGGRDLAIHITSENQRIDLNSGDLPKIEEALKLQGMSAEQRAAALAALAARRSSGEPFVSLSEADAALGPEGQSCVDGQFTIYSGSSGPEIAPSAQQDPGAMGASPMNNQIAGPGTALRLKITHPRAKVSAWILRQIPGSKGFSVLERAVCS